MKIITIIGARPQFIKISCLSRLFSINKIDEVIVHTGQHYNQNMSDIFFNELDLPKPKYNLDINNLSHGAMTGRMIEKIEEVLLKEKPNVVIVLGDTNSTLAGSLASVKLHIPICHIESGMRSYNMNMPEEINRILTDHVSTFLFCSSEKSKENLYKEGINKNVFEVGDIMYDSFLHFKKMEKREVDIKNPFCLLTIHREENTNNFDKLLDLFKCLEDIGKEFKYLFMFPVHPRTNLFLKNNNFDFLRFKQIKFLQPLSYLNMLYLQSNSRIILTDSGGIQKEAYWSHVPCITLRDETEWEELIDIGVNKITSLDCDKVYNSFKFFLNNKIDFKENLYGTGESSSKILYYIKMFFSKI